MDKQVLDKIEQVLVDILATHTDIYTEQKKTIFNNEIRSYCLDSELARDILLTLVVNDVFLFIDSKDFERAERNIRNCLGEFNLYQSDYPRLFEILRISDELKKIRRKQKLKKVRNWFIGLLIVALIILGFIINYNSYYRAERDILVSAQSNEKAFFISKVEEHDSNGLPLVNMSWYEVINYCNELSIKNNLACVYTIDEEGTVKADFTMPGYRLPTKKEWLWAAKGAKEDALTNYSGSDRWSAKEVAWFIENSSEIVHQVAKKNPNRLGLYDMSGNVAEWCWDSTEENKRIVCGGFYGNSEKYLNLASNITHVPDSGEVYIGFRLVRSYVRKNVGVEK